jgi:hypothetical protein
VFRPRHAELARGEPEFDVVFGLGPGDQPPSPRMRRELESDEPDVDAIRADRAAAVRGRLAAHLARFEPGVRAGVGALAEQLIESQLTSRDTPMLDRLHAIANSHDDLHPAAESLLRRPASYIDITADIRSIDNWQRAFMLAFLSRHFRCAVFGSPTLDGWNCSAARLGPLAYADQALAYARARIGLNVMRWQDDVGLNIKPFEITASGAACVMAHRSGTDVCFEIGREIITFHRPGEARRVIRELLDDPVRCDALALAGRARTLRDHTWRTRAGSILARLAPAAMTPESAPTTPGREQRSTRRRPDRVEQVGRDA